MPGRARRWDAFISHAGEDNAGVVVPLTEMLTSSGLKIWVDFKQLEVGDRLLLRIEEGLRNSKFGVAIFSPAFFAKHWPRAELEGLFGLDLAGQSEILPVWHNLTLTEVQQHSPMLASRFALETASGVEQVAEKLFERITGARTAAARAQRERMMALRRASQGLDLPAALSPDQVRDLVGISRRTLDRWQERRWCGSPGLAKMARYSGRDILLISALRHWDALGLKITDRVAGNIIYAVRSARMPIVLVCQAQNESVIAVPVENLADSLSGAPPAWVYDPELVLRAAYEASRRLQK